MSSVEFHKIIAIQGTPEHALCVKQPSDWIDDLAPPRNAEGRAPSGRWWHYAAQVHLLQILGCFAAFDPILLHDTEQFVRAMNHLIR